MNIDAVITAREARYRGEGNSIAPAIYNTVEELLQLREAGYLIGPDARTIEVQQWPQVRRGSLELQATARHWTYDEFDSIRDYYWRGEQVARICQAFPLEAAVFERQKWDRLRLTDPDLFGTFNDPPPDVSSLDPDVRRALSENLQRCLDERWGSSP